MLTVVSPARRLEIHTKVRSFADAMEQKLLENDFKGGWSHMNNGTIFSRIKQESLELLEALAARDPVAIRQSGRRELPSVPT